VKITGGVHRRSRVKSIYYSKKALTILRANSIKGVEYHHWELAGEGG